MDEKMKTYIGVKMIEARPMTAQEAHVVLGRIIDVTNAEVVNSRHPGYLVRYPDGYESWSPKAAFDAAYLELTDPTKICESDVDGFLGTMTVFKASEKATLVTAKTLTGFEQYAISACVDPANYDEKLGIKYATQTIKDKLWPCLGFVLQWGRDGLHRIKS